MQSMTIEQLRAASNAGGESPRILRRFQFLRGENGAPSKFGVIQAAVKDCSSKDVTGYNYLC